MHGWSEMAGLLLTGSTHRTMCLTRIRPRVRKKVSGRGAFDMPWNYRKNGRAVGVDASKPPFRIFVWHQAHLQADVSL